MFVMVDIMVWYNVIQLSSVSKAYVSVCFPCKNIEYIDVFLFFTGSDISSMSSGRRFMIDLLVSSLMADGGLEMALDAAIKCKQLQILVNMKFLVFCVFENSLSF